MTQECPHCHRPIYDEEALLCHFCGESLRRTSRGTLGWFRRLSGPMGWAAMVCALLAGYIYWAIHRAP